jgi:hypothetical protein
VRSGSVGRMGQTNGAPGELCSYARALLASPTLVTGNWGTGSPVPGFWLGMEKFTYTSHSHSLVGRPPCLDILPGIVVCYDCTSCFGPCA